MEKVYCYKVGDQIKNFSFSKFYERYPNQRNDIIAILWCYHLKS